MVLFSCFRLWRQCACGGIRLSLPPLRARAATEQCTLDSTLSASMEVDSSAGDERKESGGDALLRAADGADGGPAPAPQQAEEGQQQSSP